MSETHLLIFSAEADVGPTKKSRFGGLPSAPPEFAWPHCARCGGAMQFLGQLGQPQVERLMLLFLCQNEPGACEDWDADRGANAVILVEEGGLVLAQPPIEGDVQRNICHGVASLSVDALDYGHAIDAWRESHPDRARHILGKLGGSPYWLQHDETPNCDNCDQPMHFVAQLEEGPEAATAMNFAVGCAYVFDCECSGSPSAKLLWQP